jgi:hypothetical protein
MELDYQPIEAAHEFLVDLNRVVLTNYRFAPDQRRIFEVASARRSHLAEDYEQYRQAANQLALVGVTTRLHHWTGAPSRG